MKTLLEKSYLGYFCLTRQKVLNFPEAHKHRIDLGFFLNERSRSIVYGENLKTRIGTVFRVEKHQFKKTLTLF